MFVGNAHLIEGGADRIADILVLLEQEGIVVRGNPDVFVREYVRFGIDDARELRERAALRAHGKSPRVFIISAPTMTADAQNALLKTFEDPPGNAAFFFIVPSPQALLPTLRSRMQVLHIKKKQVEGVVDSAAFLKAEPQKRLEMLSPLLEKDDDEKRDLRPILTFLAELEIGLEKTPEGLRALYSARKYIGDKGALVKPLLEQIALLVPMLK